MAEPTSQVLTPHKPFGRVWRRLPVVGGATYTGSYYQGQMMGWDGSTVDSAGYPIIRKMTGDADLLFMGILEDSSPPNVISTDANGTYSFNISAEPFEMLLSGAAATDHGKLVFAKYSNEVTLQPTLTAGSAYGNLVGIIRHVVSTGSTGKVLIEPMMPDLTRIQGVKRLATSGPINLSVLDFGKMLYCSNGGAMTINLPASSLLPIGAKLMIVQPADANASAITLDGNGSEKINGATTNTGLSGPNKHLILTHTGISGSEFVAMVA